MVSTRFVLGGPVDRRDRYERMAGEVGGELRLVGRLELVVELVAHPCAQLVDQALGVESLEDERGAQSIERLGVVEVGLDRLGDARVLHLHRDLAPVVGDGPVHLADAGRGDRDLLPVEEDALGRATELVGHHLGGERRRHRLGVGLQRGQRLLGLVGQRLDDEAEQLPELHQRALHVAELAGDVLATCGSRTAGRAPRACHRDGARRRKRCTT